LLSTVLTWHITFLINSLAHTQGSRRYATGDTSRNNFVLALLTFGEGWHNNHHHDLRSARHGQRWWEVDFTYYVLLALRALGLVWDLQPSKALEAAKGAKAPGWALKDELSGG
jgi:stearoyl-CoA desaturase (Delta-9 desaturase)